MLYVMVDDIVFCWNGHEIVDQLKKYMFTAFNDMFYGNLGRFIRWKIAHTRGTLWIPYACYRQTILSRFEMKHYNPVNLRLSVNVDFRARYDKKTTLKPDAHQAFRAFAVRISYIERCTGPNLMYLILALDPSLHTPSWRQFSIAKGIPCYIRDTLR